MAGSSFGSGSGSNCCKSDVGIPDQFPAGLKVLVVDDDVTCLRILEQMLRRCLYNVTTCSQATVALNLLRERKGFFDVVLSDVHMPDMDGFRLLEFVGLEMDLPVIMMSADGRTNLVLRGIKHGACDYLIKPIREEELKNIWQHVIRKKWSGAKEHEHSGSLDDNDRHKRVGDDTDYASSVNEGADGMLRSHKKKRDVKEEDDCELENEDPGASKKPRVVWSVELHQQFVSAVNQLGIDKAVPKRILELMNVPGLTRENVASHLQKFRLYLKRLSGVSQQQGGSPNSFCGSIEQNPKLGSYGRFDIQALAASGQIPPQTLAALHAELLGRPTGNVGLTALDQPPLLQVSKCIPVDHGVTYGQPIMKCPSNITKPIPQSIIDDAHSGFGAWPSNSLVSNLGGLASQNGNNVLMGMLQNQQQQKHSITVQPSCLVVPSQSSANFQAGNGVASVNQTTNYNRSSIVDYNLLLPQSDGSSYSVRKASEGDIRTTVCSADAASSICQVQNTVTNTSTGGRLLTSLVDNNTGEKQICFGKSDQMLDQGPLRNLGFVGKGISIPSRFAVYEVESPTSSSNDGKVFGDSVGGKVKQEPNIDLIENSKVGIPMTQHYSQNDLMSVFTE